MGSIKFTKMTGIGNDYVYVNCFEEKIENISEFAKKVSNRNFGIGSDGLVLILPSEKEDFRMRMFNADGTEAEMCGNAIRCVAKYVYDRKMTSKTNISIETLGGIKYLDLTVEDGKVAKVKVDMGEPILSSKLIPTSFETENVVNEAIVVDDKEYNVTCVSVGNPHAIVFVDDVENIDIEKIGPKFENHAMFPKRINTEFVEIVDKTTVKMRVWERGAGETLACGTGASAVCVACNLNDLTNRNITVKLIGGDLDINWDKETNHIFMTGSATEVFNGTINEQ